MAKKNVVEIVCERCERTEYLDPTEEKVIPDLKVTLGYCDSPENKTQEVTFTELCSSCKKTVKNLFEQMTKKINWKRSKGEDVEIIP